MTQWDNNGVFDTGEVWDQNYGDLITSEHSNKPNFMAVIAALTQPFVDLQTTLQNMPQAFDLDVAVGQQLDFVGEWIGISRDLGVPLTGVYFAFDTSGVGLDEGTWLGPFDPTTELDALPDDAYRQLLYSRIANNQWDGTVPGAYSFMDMVFPGNTFFIQDYEDMSMVMGVSGSNSLNAISNALLINGYFDLKPVGVHIDYATPSEPGIPLFGFDVENSLISGLDVGGFATITQGN